MARGKNLYAPHGTQGRFKCPDGEGIGYHPKNGLVSESSHPRIHEAQQRPAFQALLKRTKTFIGGLSKNMPRQNGWRQSRELAARAET